MNVVLNWAVPYQTGRLLKWMYVSANSRSKREQEMCMTAQRPVEGHRRTADNFPRSFTNWSIKMINSQMHKSGKCRRCLFNHWCLSGKMFEQSNVSLVKCFSGCMCSIVCVAKFYVPFDWLHFQFICCHCSLRKIHLVRFLFRSEWTHLRSNSFVAI